MSEELSGFQTLAVLFLFFIAPPIVLFIGFVYTGKAVTQSAIDAVGAVVAFYIFMALITGVGQ